MSRLRLLTALCVLPCLALYTPAQDQPAKSKDAPAIEFMRAYKTAGANWSYRIVNWDREGETFSGTETCTVESIDDGQANLRTEGRSKRGNQSWSRSGPVRVEKPDSEELAWADAKLPRETLDMGFAKFVCTKHRETAGGMQTTRWVSTEWHPLVVKQVKLGANSGETRTLTSFQSGEVDPWLLYRVKGRSWTHKNTITIAGTDPMISYMRSTITSSEAKKATMGVEMLDKDKKPMAGMPPANDTTIEFAKPLVVGKPAEVIEIKHESKTVAAGEFPCLVFESGGIKSWSSTTWPGLLVALEHESGSSELVEFDLGHDPWLFYRTAGNSYTVRSETSVGGQKHSSTMKSTIKSVTKLEATVQVSIPDMKGFDMPVNKVEFEDKKSPATAYGGQREEWITTPAGSFAALVVDMGEGSKSWTWNGIAVRTVIKRDQFDTSSELIELKLE